MSEQDRVTAAIRWIERSPYLHEARLTAADGADLYAGYVAVTPGAAMWAVGSCRSGWDRAR